MTAGTEEHEPLISSSVDNQRVTYNASPQVSFFKYITLFYVAALVIILPLTTPTYVIIKKKYLYNTSY